MPWNDKSGGGGPWGGGGNGGGPWGQGPRGPGGPQGGPPDLEDIIRRGQDRLKQALPGGGHASPALFGLIGLALVALWLFQAIYTVQPDELAVELRFGKPKQELSEPGLHFHWWPIETVEYANTAEKLIQVGELRGNTSSGPDAVGRPEHRRREVLDRLPGLQSRSLSLQRRRPGRNGAPDRRERHARGGRPPAGAGHLPRRPPGHRRRGARASSRRRSTTTAPGIAINAISIEDAAPPREVADAFDEVQRAEQDEDRFVEESNQYSNQKLGQARGEAAQVREEAAAYKNRVVQEAEGEAQRFISVYDEYAKAPDITRERLFIETMEKVLKDSNKVIIEPGRAGRRALSAAA